MLHANNGNGWCLVVFAISLVLSAMPLFGAQTPSKTVSAQTQFEARVNQPTPENYRKQKNYTYKRLIEKTDKMVVDTYTERWQYHNTMAPYLAHEMRDEHLDLGAGHNIGIAASETQLRKEVAQNVLRTRVDAIVRSYLSNPRLSKVIKKVNENLEKVKNVQIQVSEDPAGPKLNIGYDVYSDEAKLEYGHGALNAGLYHPKTLASMTGAEIPGDLKPQLRAGAKLGQGLPSLGASYRLDSGMIGASLSKALTENLSSELVSSQPISKTADAAFYGMNFSYRF